MTVVEGTKNTLPSDLDPRRLASAFSMMPSNRRVRLLAVAVLVVVGLLFYYSNDASSQDFYTRTVSALDKKKTSNPDMTHKMQEAKQAADNQAPIAGLNQQKPLAGDNGDDRSHTVEAPEKIPTGKSASAQAPSDNRPIEEKKELEISVAGRKTMKPAEGQKDGLDGAKEADISKGSSTASASAKEPTAKTETKEEHEIEMELNSILKKGPIIVFSKSYCPYSMKAKRILLEKYTIVPAPYVVELDQHPLGSKLQTSLEKMTGRRTVPNVLINGKSIGGGDDIEALDAESKLIDKVKTLGGKRIMEAKLTEEKSS